MDCLWIEAADNLSIAKFLSELMNWEKIVNDNSLNK